MKSKHLENNKFKKIKIKTIDHVNLTFFFSYVCKLTKVINIAYLIELTLAYHPPPHPPVLALNFGIFRLENSTIFYGIGQSTFIEKKKPDSNLTKITEIITLTTMQCTEDFCEA